MTTDKILIQQLKEEFFNKYSKKYKLLSNDALGEGCYACVFKGFDIDRNINVAIKIFFDGIAPKGSERGWHITSSIIHNQIAPTSTIESFYSEVLSKNCKAVVQRFIPGKTLKSILKKFDELEKNENYQDVLNDFGLSYFESLLNVLNFCHSQNIGHGDCHDGNIMIFPEQHPSKNSFHVVLIDFDNSSIKETLNAKSEKEKIESDIGLLKYFFNKTFCDWKYYEAVKIMLDSYDKMKELKFCYSIISNYIESCIKGNKTESDAKKTLHKLPHPFMGFHIPPTIKCLQKVAEIEGVSSSFEKALKDYRKVISNQENWKHEITIETIKGEVTDIYRKLFDD